MADDPYATLGVARDATVEQIKRAYRRAARKHHPDLNPGKPEAEARFRAVSAAHDLLSDPERRARFDRGEIDAEGRETPSAYDWPPHRRPGGYRRHAEEAEGERYGRAQPEPSLDDLFSELFEAGRRADTRPRRGADAQYRLQVPFEAAVTGATERLALPDGQVLDIRIPPGIVTGTVLRLRGRGEPGRNGAPPGDALIEVEVAEHGLWRREGRDVRMDLRISLKEAVLGGAVEVPTPSGRVRVTLPRHGDTGRQIRLRGKGVAAHDGQPAGDLLLTLRVVIGQPDQALESFLRTWDPEHRSDPRADLEGSG